MRIKLNATEGIFPMPVLTIATYNEDGSVNVMNAAWGTMQEVGTVTLNLTESHKTVKISRHCALSPSVSQIPPTWSRRIISVWSRETGPQTSLHAAG